MATDAAQPSLLLPEVGGRLLAALDIVGTKSAGAVVDAEGRVRHRARRPTPAGVDSAVLGAVLEVLAELTEHQDWRAVTALGIGSAGPVDIAAGTVSPVNIPAWRGFPIVERVRAHPAVAG